MARVVWQMGVTMDGYIVGPAARVRPDQACASATSVLVASICPSNPAKDGANER